MIKIILYMLLTNFNIIGFYKSKNLLIKNTAFINIACKKAKEINKNKKNFINIVIKFCQLIFIANLIFKRNFLFSKEKKQKNSKISSVITRNNNHIVYDNNSSISNQPSYNNPINNSVNDIPVITRNNNDTVDDNNSLISKKSNTKNTIVKKNNEEKSIEAMMEYLKQNEERSIEAINKEKSKDFNKEQEMIRYSDLYNKLLFFIKDKKIINPLYKKDEYSLCLNLKNNQLTDEIEQYIEIILKYELNDEEDLFLKCKLHYNFVNFHVYIDSFVFRDDSSLINKVIEQKQIKEKLPNDLKNFYDLMIIPIENNDIIQINDFRLKSVNNLINHILINNIFEKIEYKNTDNDILK